MLAGLATTRAVPRFKSNAILFINTNTIMTMTTSQTITVSEDNCQRRLCTARYKTLDKHRRERKALEWFQLNHDRDAQKSTTVFWICMPKKGNSDHHRELKRTITSGQWFAAFERRIQIHAICLSPSVLITAANWAVKLTTILIIHLTALWTALCWLQQLSRCVLV